MPPKKRTRATVKVSSDNHKSPSKSPVKRLKTDQKLVAAEKDLPEKPEIDTYKPIAKAQNKDEAREKAIELITRNIRRTRLTKLDREIGLKLLVSNLEADLLLGKDGKTNIEIIESRSGAKVLVDEHVQGSIDREIDIVAHDGDLRNLVKTTLDVIVFLKALVELRNGVDDVYSATLLIPDSYVAQLKEEESWKTLIKSEHIDLSTNLHFLSSYRSLYISGKLSEVMFKITSLAQNLEKIDLSTLVIPTEKVPVYGLHLSTVKSQTNQILLNRSKVALAEYLKQETNKSNITQDTADPKKHTLEQLETALKECEKNQENLNSVRFRIDFPLDKIPLLTNEDNLKLNEIRSKSNSNVVIEPEIVDVEQNQYKVIQINGLNEYNQIALTYLKSLL